MTAEVFWRPWTGRSPPRRSGSEPPPGARWICSSRGADDARADPPVQSSTVSPREILEWEKELLGTYMSDHPLSEISGRGACDLRPGAASAKSLNSKPDSLGSTVRLLAMVASIRRIVTKTERSMAVVVLEDLTGRVDLVLFPDAFERYGESLREGVMLDVRGRLERRGEALQIVCESLSAELPTAGPDVYEPETIVDPVSSRRRLMGRDQGDAGGRRDPEASRGGVLRSSSRVPALSGSRVG